jgi:hypothetical protein
MPSAASAEGTSLRVDRRRHHDDPCPCRRRAGSTSHSKHASSRQRIERDIRAVVSPKPLVRAAHRDEVAALVSASIGTWLDVMDIEAFMATANPPRDDADRDAIRGDAWRAARLASRAVERQLPAVRRTRRRCPRHRYSRGPKLAVRRIPSSRPTPAPQQPAPHARAVSSPWHYSRNASALDSWLAARSTAPPHLQHHQQERCVIVRLFARNHETNSLSLRLFLSRIVWLTPW